MKSIEAECCIWFAIYGRLEFFKTVIVTGHRLSPGTGMGQPVLCIVGRA